MIYIKILSGRNKRFTKTTITKENMQDDNKTNNLYAIIGA